MVNEASGMADKRCAIITLSPMDNDQTGTPAGASPTRLH